MKKEQEKIQKNKYKEKMKEMETKVNQEKQVMEEDLKMEKNEVKQKIKDLKDVIKRLKSELKATNQDIIDREEEYEEERQDFLETIRGLTRENELYEQIILNFISKSELSNVWSKSKYDEESEKWFVPPIIPRNNWKSVVPLPDINMKRKCINIIINST